MSVATIRHTEDEYFEMETASELKHEYIDGEILEMGGGSLPHNDISGNLVVLLKARFPRPSYRVLFANTRVRVPDPIADFYPDAAVVEGEVECEPNRPDTVLNPKVIFEILSPSTERFDRGRKLELYQKIESVQECVLISQYEPAIDRFSRQTDGSWIRDRIAGFDATLTLASVNWNVKLSDIYKDVEFEPKQ